MALIEFRNVRKVFGPKVVYEDLHLDVHAGESLTIIGGSGMGKSVMLKMLIGLLRADGGTITFDGKRIDDKGEREFPAIRRRIGMLFQGAALFDSMSVYDNVAYGLREHERLPENEIEERVAKALEDVGLPGTQRSMPTSLSGGQRKRVGLARAIAIRPQVLLYDEPTTGLDPINTERINQLIVETKKLLNVTSIVVTHDMESAFEISDRIAMIHKGYVVWSGTVDDARSTDNPQVRDFIMGHAPETDDAATLLRYGG
ncbi:ABC transporter ATP-binding protein [Sandaracinus amylolyticus]|uniref:Methionine ABC transporter ATP-binding protein n=1 Tax=Sandaracinus amylolyticus TaxID=927083 RepID=A0A0F6SEQ9_9BACT|nr:ABC transporter ATP-binding protein [Sandaracinus amylolyticus]AKF05624.1 Methionine ABC transporter ATP-binding protein [Sandaracinus amylolyticus]